MDGGRSEEGKEREVEIANDELTCEGDEHEPVYSRDHMSRKMGF